MNTIRRLLFVHRLADWGYCKVATEKSGQLLLANGDWSKAARREWLLLAPVSVRRFAKADAYMSRLILKLISTSEDMEFDRGRVF